VEAYGDVDELNSTIGIVRAFNPELVGNHLSADRLEEELRWMQNKLFDVCGLLPRRPGKRSRMCQRSQPGREPAGKTHG
jgi:cob(I)alamin adenosyltransferase